MIFDGLLASARTTLDRLNAALKMGEEIRDRALKVLEQIWVYLMNIIGPIWLASGRMSKEALFTFLKFFPTMAVEMIPARRNPQTQKWEILMFPRGDDPFPEYANRLHTPGCMLMPGMSIKQALDRVVESETGVGYVVMTGLPVSVELGTSPRGYEVPIAFIVKLTGELPANSKGVWVPIGDLLDLYGKDAIIRAQYLSFLGAADDWLSECDEA